MINRLDLMVQCSEKGIEFKPEHKELFNEYKKHALKKHNGYTRIRLDPPRRKRTTGENSQSHHVNGDITAIANALQRDFDQVKKFMKYKAIEHGYPILTDDDGNPVFDLWDHMQGISETDCSVEECGILIETCHVFAAENGIELKEH